MTDQTIPADKVRKIVNDMRRHADHDAVRGREEEYVGQFADLLEALLPAPPRLTLADMTDEERRACRWMQADVAYRSVRYVIATPCDDDVALIAADGGIEWMDHDAVTPRPDLPRLEWPGEAPVPPNTLAAGSVWDDLDGLIAACRKSGRDQIVVTESDGDVSAWNKSIDGWTPSLPTVGYEPFTIIHAGKEADQ